MADIAVMAGGIRNLKTSSRTSSEWNPAGDGSPWEIRIDSSCNTGVGAPGPIVQYHLFVMKKHVCQIGSLGDHALLSADWEETLDTAAMNCVDELSKRQAPFSGILLEELRSALRSARIKAILFLVAYQAECLIRHIPSKEACRLWSEAEARHVLAGS